MREIQGSERATYKEREEAIEHLKEFSLQDVGVNYFGSNGTTRLSLPGLKYDFERGKWLRVGVSKEGIDWSQRSDDERVVELDPQITSDALYIFDSYRFPSARNLERGDFTGEIFARVAFFSALLRGDQWALDGLGMGEPGYEEKFESAYSDGYLSGDERRSVPGSSTTYKVTHVYLPVHPSVIEMHEGYGVIKGIKGIGDPVKNVIQKYAVERLQGLEAYLADIIELYPKYKPVFSELHSQLSEARYSRDKYKDIELDSRYLNVEIHDQKERERDWKEANALLEELAKSFERLDRYQSKESDRLFREWNRFVENRGRWNQMRYVPRFALQYVTSLKRELEEEHGRVLEAFNKRLAKEAKDKEYDTPEIREEVKRSFSDSITLLDAVRNSGNIPGIDSASVRELGDRIIESHNSFVRKPNQEDYIAFQVFSDQLRELFHKQDTELMHKILKTHDCWKTPEAEEYLMAEKYNPRYIAFRYRNGQLFDDYGHPTNAIGDMILTDDGFGKLEGRHDSYTLKNGDYVYFKQDGLWEIKSIGDRPYPLEIVRKVGRGDEGVGYASPVRDTGDQMKSAWGAMKNAPPARSRASYVVAEKMKEPERNLLTTEQLSKAEVFLMENIQLLHGLIGLGYVNQDTAQEVLNELEKRKEILSNTSDKKWAKEQQKLRDSVSKITQRVSLSDIRKAKIAKIFGVILPSMKDRGVDLSELYNNMDQFKNEIVLDDSIGIDELEETISAIYE